MERRDVIFTIHDLTLIVTYKSKIWTHDLEINLTRSLVFRTTPTLENTQGRYYLYKVPKKTRRLNLLTLKETDARLRGEGRRVD